MDVSVTIQSQNPAGTSLDFRGGNVPFGYLPEDGSVVSRVTYARLFEAIGTTYGAGDGATTFKLPDSRGRVNVGSGLGSGLTDRVLGATGGEENHLLTENELASHTHVQNPHNHAITDPGHTHAISLWSSDTNGGVSRVGSNSQVSTVQTASNTTGISINNQTATNQSTGGNQAHNNMQPFLVVRKIIKF